MVAQLSEIFLPQPEECRSVEFRISPDVIVCVRVKRLAALVPPHLLRLILALDIYCHRIPVIFLPRDVVASLDQQDAFTRRGKRVGESSPTRSAPDDDDVELFFSSQV